MRRFNINEFISLLVLILVVALVAFLIITGDIQNFLSEKSAANLKIVLIILPVLIIVQATKILAREEMNCCAADSFIIGVKSMADEKFNEGQWIKALGKIEYNGEYYLNIYEYIKINEPKNIYF